MTMPPPMPDRRYQKRMSTGSKVLIGCGVGCGTIILLVVIAFAIGAWWFFSTEDQVSTDKILNSGSSAAFRLEDISHNQEVMQLISDLFKEAQRINQDRAPVHLPEPFENFKRYFENQQDPKQFIIMFSPTEATVSISLDETGSNVFVIAANFGTGTRMVKMALNAAFENDEFLKDKKISTGHGDLFIFDKRNNWNRDNSKQGIFGYCKGTFIFSNDRDAAISALDNLAEEGNAGNLNDALSDPFSSLSREGSLAYGVLDGSFLKNPDNRIGLFKSEFGTEIKKAEISLDELSTEKGVLNLHIDWNNKDFASKGNEEIEKLKTEWINRAEQNGFDMEIINSLEDEKLNIKFQINNMKESLIYLIQNAD